VTSKNFQARAEGPGVAVRIPSDVRPLLQRIGLIAEARGLSAYAVGGCVRDWCCGLRDGKDVDVTVEGSGVELARTVAEALDASLTVHEQFGTATICLSQGQRRRIDVASCRKETYARPAAYPRVSRGTLEEDLLRRDFTINAMAVAVNPGRFGTLIDPFHGARDLCRRRLRVLHARSFLDDPSRILRGVRFVRRFGLRWERHTAAALRHALAAGALGWLNQGRLQRELDRMLVEPDPLACLQELARLLDAVARAHDGRSRTSSP